MYFNKNEKSTGMNKKGCFLGNDGKRLFSAAVNPAARLRRGLYMTLHIIPAFVRA
jgi:hypothetical protein